MTSSPNGPTPAVTGLSFRCKAVAGLVLIGACTAVLWDIPLWVQLGHALALSVVVLVWRQRPGARLRRELGSSGWLGLRQWWGHARARAGQRLGVGIAVSRRPAAVYGAQVGRVVSGWLWVRGRAVFSPWSRGILVLGPPGSGKSSWLVRPILDAPGAAYVSSTKTELVQMTAQLRSQRGEVHVFNPTGLGAVASTFGWNPVSGCVDPAIADARARALVRGGGGAASGQHAEFWASKAAEIVRCYLLAAALSDEGMAAVMGWALNPSDPTPTSVLEQHPDRVPQGWVGTLQRNLGAAPNERSGYFSAVVPAVAFVDNALVAAACSPRPGENFDVDEFLSSGAATVYVIAGDGDRRVAPLLTALTEAVFDAAKRLAAAAGGRLDPPLSLFLDEVANTTPVPLDNWAADSRGWGITVCAVAQDLAQLESRWGRTRAQSIFANLPTKVVLPGVTETRDLDSLAYLAGHRRVRQTSESTSISGSGRSRSRQRSWSREPVVTGHMIYQLPRWHAYVLGLGPRAVVVRFEPGYAVTAAALRRLARLSPVPLGWETATPVSPGEDAVVTQLRPRDQRRPAAVPRQPASRKLTS